MKKKILSIVLAVIMVVGIFPITAFAAEGVEAKWGSSKDNLTKSGSLADAIYDAKRNGATYIQIQKDIIASADVTNSYAFSVSGGNFTIDMNGKTISCDTAAVFTIIGGTVVFDGNGTLQSSSGSCSLGVSNPLSSSPATSVTLKSGTFKGVYGVAVSLGANLYIEGNPTITGTNSSGEGSGIQYNDGKIHLEKYTGPELKIHVTPSRVIGDVVSSISNEYACYKSNGEQYLLTDQCSARSVVIVKKAPSSYPVTIENGTADKAEAEKGDTVTVTANPPETGKLFSGWTSGDVTFTDATAMTTTFEMPAKSVTVTANYSDCTHEDENKDHVCDNGCGVPQGICEDSDFDHNCDYGCNKPYGEHNDSADDKDHVCDYGCGAVLENCSDKTGDKDHKCDICGKENITGHSFKDATCTEPKTCGECGETEGKALGHNYTGWVVINEPTENESGTKMKTCRECGNKIYKDIKPLSEDGVRDLVPGEKGENEQNPNTGAPVTVPFAAFAILSVAVVFKKKK